MQSIICTIPSICILIGKQHCRLETSQALKLNHSPLLVTIWMALRNDLNFFEFQLPHLQNGS